MVLPKYLTIIKYNEKKLWWVIHSNFDLLIDNIKQQRDLVKLFIIISSGIIGFTIPVFGRTDLIKNPYFLIFGLLILLSVILCGFLYLTQRIQGEYNNLYSGFSKREFYNQSLDIYLNNPTDENFTKYQDKHAEILDQLRESTRGKSKRGDKDYFFDIIFASFFAALIFIVLSMVDICIYCR